MNTYGLDNNDEENIEHLEEDDDGREDEDKDEDQLKTTVWVS